MFSRYPGESHLLRVVTVESAAESAAGGDVRNYAIDQALGVREEVFLFGCLMQR